MLTTLAINNYRSILNVVIPLGALNVITGPNGSGKSNVYRALRLRLGFSSQDFGYSIALGLPKILWQC